ncbi:MAG TPA: sigma-70 family RNA polymerase sigma factor [Steroidobacteraceae bacterium]
MTESFGLEYIDALYGYALMLTRNHVEGEDLVQETYVRALQARHRLPDENNLKGWFFTILRNLWLNQLRKQKTEPRLVEVDGEDGGADLPPGTTRDSYQLLSAEEDAEQVHFAIAQLSPEFREVIVLREFEQLSYQEIAGVIDCPAGTVMSRLGRARANLRELLVKAWRHG